MTQYDIRESDGRSRITATAPRLEPVGSSSESAAGLHRVVALVMPPQSPFELASAAEVFGTKRSRIEPKYAFTTATPRPGLVVGLGGFDLHVPHGLAALADADTIVIPGYSRHDEPADPRLLDALRRAHARGTRLAAICSGAFLLAQTGLLDRRRATVHWRMREELRRLHPLVEVDSDPLYIDHGDVATSAGTAAGIDLCLHLVRADFGASYATRIARHMVMPPQREGGQLQYADDHLPAADGDSLAPLLDWATARLGEKLSLDELARRAHVSPRTLSRRFWSHVGMSPAQWVMTQRINSARELLENSDLTLDVIAATVGLSTAANLRERFQRAVGTTPSAYRRTFRRSAA